MSFPPEIFARLQPQVFLGKHLQLGVRPGDLRKFNEERPVITRTGALESHESHIIGSAVTRQGQTTVVCGITASTTESAEAHGRIYPNVEVLRGTTLAMPTPEEMRLSQQLFELIETLAIDTNQIAFKIEKEGDFVVSRAEGRIDDRNDDQGPFVFLQASIQVLSRSGPCLEVCCNTLIAALADTKVPKLSIDVDTGKLKTDFEHSRSLELPFDAQTAEKGTQKFFKSFAVWNHEIIADLEGDAEEQVLASKSEISVLSVEQEGTRRLKGMTIRAMPYGSARVNKQDIEKVFSGLG